MYHQTLQLCDYHVSHLTNGLVSILYLTLLMALCLFCISPYSWPCVYSVSRISPYSWPSVYSVSRISPY